MQTDRSSSFYTVDKLRHDAGALRHDVQAVSKRRGLVGILIGNFDSRYYGDLTEYASNYLSKRDCHAIVQSNSGTKFGEMEAQLILNECHCDGFILHSETLSNHELSQLMEKYPTSVMINRDLPLHRDKCVFLNNTCGGRLAGLRLAYWRYIRFVVL